MAVYDRVVPNNALDSLWVLTSAAVTITVFDLVMKLLRSYLVESAARKADLAMSSHRLRPCASTARRQPAGLRRVLANVVRDFESVRFASSATLNLLGDMPFMLFFLAVIAMIGGWMVAVPLLLIPLTLGYRGGFAPISTELASNMQEGARTAHLFEVMNGLDTVRAWAPTPGPAQVGNADRQDFREHPADARMVGLWQQLRDHDDSLSTVLLVMVGALLIADGKLFAGPVDRCFDALQPCPCAGKPARRTDPALATGKDVARGPSTRS